MRRLHAAANLSQEIDYKQKITPAERVYDGGLFFVASLGGGRICYITIYNYDG